MKSRCIILFSSPYRMVKENTGEIIEGISLRYVMAENLNPCQTNERKGYSVAKESVPIGKLSSIKEVPAFYDVEFECRVDSNGKPLLKIKDVEFVSRFELIS